MADPPDRDAAGCAFVGPCQAGRWISAARVLREATLRGQHGVGGATGAATPTAGDRWVHLPAAAFDHRRLCDAMGALDGSALVEMEQRIGAAMVANLRPRPVGAGA